MALPREVGGDKYVDAMRAMGESFDWRLGRHPFDANDQALAQAYIALYKRDGNRRALRSTQRHIDHMLKQSRSEDEPIWWWCDALFMAPSVFTELSQVTGRQDYTNFMNSEWWKTSAALYDQRHHLYYRDKRFLAARDHNGRPVFW